MQFHVMTHNEPWPDAHDQVLLRPDEWNDWFEFRTLFRVFYRQSNGDLADIGPLKIGDLEHTYRNESGGGTQPPRDFDALPKRFVSLGQDESFYYNLRRVLGADRTKLILGALNDLAINPNLFERVRAERVVDSSLMRSVTSFAVRGPFARIIASGDARAAYDFAFFRRSENPLEIEPLTLDFAVVPASTPPANVHVIIGRNGSGKTTLLKSMAATLLGEPYATPRAWFGTQTDLGRLDVANLVYVAFSAFDIPNLPVTDSPRAYAIPYSYVGLQEAPSFISRIRAPDEQEPLDAEKRTRAPEELADDFASSARAVVREKSIDLWREALQNLESDPNFEEAGVSALADVDPEGLFFDDDEFSQNAVDLFNKRLSSGHKIVLLTVTRLVQTVTERTLVLLDEPEGHLHPPLLSAFTRALADLMRARNGIAIVATHSPVILQEVPSKCVWRVRRSGTIQLAERPDKETFGENVGTLTNAVFGLEVTASGFHKMLIEYAERFGDYQRVLDEFGNELGFEARAALRAWFAARQPQ